MQTDLARAEQKRAKKQERADELTSEKEAAQDKADERLAGCAPARQSTDARPKQVWHSTCT